MRVALLSDCYPPRLGGIEVQVHDLAHRLTAAGHDVEVVTATVGPGGEAGGDRTEEDGVPVHRFAVPLPAIGGLPIPVNPLAHRRLAELLARGRFDVAHAHMGVVSPFAFDLVGLALHAGLPTAVTWHCVVDSSAPVHRLLGYAARWARDGAALSAVSTMAADRVSTIAEGSPVAVLHNGIDVDHWRAPTERDGRGRWGTTGHEGGTVRVVSAQRMVLRKRPLALLHVLRRARVLAPASVRLEAVIVGDGPQRRRMQAWLRARGLDWIRLPGRVTRDELRDLHWGSDIYLTAARLEAFGIAALEARTAGLPVVALAGTGADDFIEHEVSGLLADDDRELAGQLARIIRDSKLRQQVAAHNRLVPPAAAWPAVVDATLAEYQRARGHMLSAGGPGGH